MPTDDWFVEDTRLKAALARVVERVHPLKIITFGSRAAGTHRPESDLDLAILFEGPPSGPTSGAAWKTFAEFHIPVDLLNVSQEHHQRFRGSINGVHREIAERGVLLYDVSIGRIDPNAVSVVSRG